MRILSRILSLSCLLLLVGLVVAQDPKKEDVPKLIKELSHGKAKNRMNAAEELGELGAIKAEYTKSAVPALVELVKKDVDAKVRAAAAKALGRMAADPKQAVPVLTEALKDKAPAVRVASARALGQLGSAAKDALPALQEAAKDKDKDRAFSQASKDAIRSIRSK